MYFVNDAKFYFIKNYVLYKENNIILINFNFIIMRIYGKTIKLFVSELGVKGSKLKLSKFRDESKAHEVLKSKLAKIIKQGINKGLFRAVDPTIAAKSLVAILETIILETTGCFDRDTVTEMFKKVEQLFIDVLLKAGGQDNEKSN